VENPEDAASAVEDALATATEFTYPICKG